MSERVMKDEERLLDKDLERRFIAEELSKEA